MSSLNPRKGTAPKLPYFVLSHQQENEYADQHYGPGTWQCRMLRFIHSHKVQATLLFLLGVEVIGLFVAIFLNLEYPACFIIERSCIGVNTSSLELDGACSAACVHHKDVEAAEFGLEILSLVILSIFELELICLMLLLGRMFFHNAAYILDFVIVTITIGLIASVQTEVERNVSGLLIFTRTWRFVRVGHGIFTEAMELEEHSIETLEKHISYLKGVLQDKRHKSTQVKVTDGG